jgi:hypothetical protein
MRRALVVLLVLVLAACGDDDGDASRATTTTAPATPTTAAVEDLPGERVEIFPYEDAELAVVGVAADDVLNLRSGPGADFEVVAELEPRATGLVATGHNRSLDEGGFWNEVRVGDDGGWVNAAFVAQPGQVDDITSEVAATPDRPRASTMEELGRLVGATRASDEPPSEIVVVDGPELGDLGEVTVDVIGMGDDAVRGERLAVFGTPEPGGAGFTLRTVERTVLCARGVTPEGLCV